MRGAAGTRVWLLGCLGGAGRHGVIAYAVHFLGLNMCGVKSVQPQIPHGGLTSTAGACGKKETMGGQARRGEGGNVDVTGKKPDDNQRGGGCVTCASEGN